MPRLTPESALLSKLEVDTTSTIPRSILVSHIILIFKKKIRKIEFLIVKDSNKLEFHFERGASFQLIGSGYKKDNIPLVT